MKVLSAMMLGIMLAASSPANAQFMTDHGQLSRWLRQMPVTSPEVLALDTQSRNSVACLAMNIYHEARGSILKEQIAVAHVTLNRTHNALYDTDVCNTVFQYAWGHGRKRPQFSWTTRTARAPRESEVWIKIQNLALRVYQREIQDPTRGATFFHDAQLRPGWVQHPYQVTFIGTSRFFRMRLPS
jgi:spore germination cell wall hydrolase CwlJ-like protein